MFKAAVSKPVAFKPAVLIPVYNHENAIELTLKETLQHNCPVLLVDDGSDPVCRDLLIVLTEKHSDMVQLLRLERNSGKGAAVRAGFRKLHSDGFSHAVQIDSDGQHDLADLPAFLETAQKNPGALVAGYPIYDESVPKSRYLARYLTHVWVWINTISFTVRDSMCGYRVYPLNAIVNMLQINPCGDRMSFDTEVIVRWVWNSGGVINLPTAVSYPLDGVSHFDLWRDNLHISLMHTRLFFGMLWRLPKLVWKKIDG
ncbi:MAG: glycosyltransferase family 2 protein [Pseudomonadales bacterium]|nr:glycosyltransferase family 2 protein [Pseudomonadales bacterium]